MKKILFYALAATTLALTSCKKNVLETPSAADNAIHIVASIASQARAPQLANDGSGSFSQGDKMSLFLTEDDANNQSVDYEYGSGILTWGSLGLADCTVCNCRNFRSRISELQSCPASSGSDLHTG